MNDDKDYILPSGKTLCMPVLMNILINTCKCIK